MGKKLTSRNVQEEQVSRVNARASKRQLVPIESVQNDQRPLPADVAALFDDQLSRSVQTAHAGHQLKMKVDEANAKFRQEQVLLMDSLSKQLGLLATVKDLAVLRERRVRTVSEAMEKTHSAISDERTRAGAGTMKSKPCWPDGGQGRS